MYIESGRENCVNEAVYIHDRNVCIYMDYKKANANSYHLSITGSAYDLSSFQNVAEQQRVFFRVGESRRTFGGRKTISCDWWPTQVENSEHLASISLFLSLSIYIFIIILER